jgi:hypothetical protein
MSTVIKAGHKMFYGVQDMTAFNFPSACGSTLMALAASAISALGELNVGVRFWM